jgi:hypothetical protein
VLPIQIPGGPELLVVVLLVLPSIIAAYLTYRTGTAAGDPRARLWAAAIGVLTVFGLVPGVVALAVYSYDRGAG